MGNVPLRELKKLWKFFGKFSHFFGYIKLGRSERNRKFSTSFVFFLSFLGKIILALPRLWMAWKRRRCWLNKEKFLEVFSHPSKSKRRRQERSDKKAWKFDWKENWENRKFPFLSGDFVRNIFRSIMKIQLILPHGHKTMKKSLSLTKQIISSSWSTNSAMSD